MSPRGAIAVLVWLGAALLAPAVAQALEQPLRVAAPSRAHGATVARLLTPTFARHRLESARRAWRVDAATAWSRHAQVMLVLDAATYRGRAWVKVLLAKRPNGSTGWIPRDRVALGRSRYWIEVRKRERRVAIYRDGRRLRRFRAVVGAAATPTPVGLAAVYERSRQPDAHGAFGPWVLALTSLSDVLRSFGGGPGRIAIHGGGLASVGSHGCVRVPTRRSRGSPPGSPSERPSTSGPERGSDLETTDVRRRTHPNGRGSSQRT
jgi:L,D-transpeptidase catalytic domain